MSWVLGLWGGGGLKEALEEVLILPAEKERQLEEHTEGKHKQNDKEGDKKSGHLVLQQESSVPCKRCVSPHPAVRTHTVVPGSRHQQHWAGGCVSELHSRNPSSVSLSPTPPPALSWFPRGPYTSSLMDTGGQKTQRDDVCGRRFNKSEHHGQVILTLFNMGLRFVLTMLRGTLCRGWALLVSNCTF